MNDAFDELVDDEILRIEALDAADDLLRQFKDQGALVAILHHARLEAADAYSSIATCDPFDGATIRELQWRITRFSDLCRWIRRIHDTGELAAADLTEEQAAELERLRRGEEAEAKDA